MARIAHPDRVRQGNYKPLSRDGKWICLDCGDPVLPHNYGAGRHRIGLRCSPCSSFNYLYRTILSGKTLAARAVNLAKRSGTLAPATDFACADCGKPAREYDHRDYNEPLRVEPVCHSCNVMRGPAIPYNPFVVGLLLAARLAA